MAITQHSPAETRSQKAASSTCIIREIEDSHASVQNRQFDTSASERVSRLRLTGVRPSALSGWEDVPVVVKVVQRFRSSTLACQMSLVTSSPGPATPGRQRYQDHRGRGSEPSHRPQTKLQLCVEGWNGPLPKSIDFVGTGSARRLHGPCEEAMH